MSSARVEGRAPVVVLESPAHAGTLLRGLDALRAQGLLLDVTLHAQGQAFQAHRAVLASCSDYFRAMFTDAMLEARQREVRLRGVPAEGMRLLLDYAYTARLALHPHNVQDVLAAASHVQVGSVVEACAGYLQRQLDVENAVDVATIAETYSLEGLRRRAYRFMSGHLREFAASRDLHRLAPQQLEHLLACDFPVDCSETEILEMVVQWIRAQDTSGQKQRMSYVSRFLRHVHLAELTKWEIEWVLQKHLSEAARPERQLYRHLRLEAVRRGAASCTPSTPRLAGGLLNSRGMELAIVKVGGFGLGGITNEITYYLPSEGRWKRLTAIPHLEQCNFGSAVLANELYVVGGCYNQALQENIHPFGFRYDPRLDAWATLAPMRRDRCRFSLHVAGARLYAVGGCSDPDGEAEGAAEDTAGLERYDPATDTWTQLRGLTGARAQHAGCAFPLAAPTRLMVAGGLLHDTVTATVWGYELASDTWAPLACMLRPRADHSLLALGDAVYACGGWHEDVDSSRRLLLDTIDVYDPREDRWRVETTVPTPRYHAGVVAFGTKIYLIGGFHSDATFDRATASIDCYDVLAREWSSAAPASYPQELWEHGAVALFVPRHSDDLDVPPDARHNSISLSQFET